MTGKIKMLLLASVLLLTFGCNKNEKVTIRGTFSGVEAPVYLDQIGVRAVHLIDTAVTDDKGRFKFTVTLPDKQPAFYNLRCNGQTITLLVAPGEKIEVKSLGNLANNYLVEGSKGSEEIKELNLMRFRNLHALDSLANIYFSLEPENPEVQSALTQYSRLFINHKREMISFVITNATSLSSIYALYQRMPDGEWVFADNNDRVYFEMVADSLESRFPRSPHVTSLLKDVERMQNNLALTAMLENATMSTFSFPDIELPDVLGNRVKLSSFQGEVILLDFWLSTAPESRLQNAELKEIYAEYADKGLMVYQVALDQNKLAWITAVQEQKIPWVSVCDLKGLNSPAVRLYNVTGLPANVLINRDGEIVGRNIPVEKLGTEIRKFL